jgi:hypothetical protein
MGHKQKGTRQKNVHMIRGLHLRSPQTIQNQYKTTNFVLLFRVCRMIITLACLQIGQLLQHQPQQAQLVQVPIPVNTNFPCNQSSVQKLKKQTSKGSEIYKLRNLLPFTGDITFRESASVSK